MFELKVFYPKKSLLTTRAGLATMDRKATWQSPWRNLMKIPEFLTRLMAERCEHCPLCRYARENPDRLISKAVAFHGKFCPFWQAREKVYGTRSDPTAR
jgi:hypothetical protein